MGLLYESQNGGFIGNLAEAKMKGLSGKQDVLAIPGEEEDDVVHDEQGEIAWDDVTGTQLDPVEVNKARLEEIRHYKQMGVFRKVPIEECLRVIGKPPVSVRWVDPNKGRQRQIFVSITTRWPRLQQWQG